MPLSGKRTFAGFGFGAIQAGLYLYEAFQSGNFGRLVVAEVMPEVVKAVREAGGMYTVNIAYADRVEQVQVGPVEILDPADEGDCRQMVEAIAEAEEMGTAVPSVQFYKTDGPGSIHRVLTEGLRRKVADRGPRSVLYAAENHNQAAEILEDHLLLNVPGLERNAVCGRIRILNTVIGKMSGVLTDPAEIAERGLAPVTPGGDRAFLVEAFNKILISKIAFEGTPFKRGITVFQEKKDLLPFEEAKLFGHNATHATAACIGALRGAQQMTELLDAPGVPQFLLAAFIEESGGGLIRKHDGVDPLFTPKGYEFYVKDLLKRMFNAHLNDKVERVARDMERKLGWDDRFIGTMRMAISQGINPRRYSFGAACALAVLDRSILEDKKATPQAVLGSIWAEDEPDPAEARNVSALIDVALGTLRKWQAAGFPDLRQHFK